MSESRIFEWIPDEAAHAGPEHLDPEYVETYDLKTGPEPADDVDLLRSLGLDQTSTLIDLGAGTGSLALAAAPYCRRVIAVDVSPAMVRLLRQKVDQSGLTNIECVLGGFLSYEHQGAPADFIVSRHALHHLPDFWKAVALQRMADVLRPGGILRLRDLVYSFSAKEAEEIFGTWLDHAAPSEQYGWTREELEMHIREEFSTFSWLLEPMLEQAGFTIQAIEHAPTRVFSAYTCVRG